MAAEAAIRVLFVDDEPGIRQTLPAILVHHGFQVTATETVAEALKAITLHPFDALIADLNIGEAGDGFTVVSAMRRIQPECVNFILTGYPAFESALQAIRNQVDDYLVKPANIESLVASLRNKLTTPRTARHLAAEPLANFLRKNVEAIVAKVLAAMKAHPRLLKIPLSDAARVDHIPALLNEVIRQLESKKTSGPTREMLQAGAQHGQTRRKQGYSEVMLVDDTRILDSTIYDMLQNNLLTVELSNLVPDLSRLNDGLEAHLQEALRAFLAEEAA